MKKIKKLENEMKRETCAYDGRNHCGRDRKGHQKGGKTFISH